MTEIWLKSFSLIVVCILLIVSCSENRSDANKDVKSINSNTQTNSGSPENRKDSEVEIYTVDNVGKDGVVQPEYNIEYAATKETDWISNPQEPNPTTGKLKAGDLVKFNRVVGTTKWQDAKLSDGSIKFVHPADFAKVPPPPAPIMITAVSAEFLTGNDDKDGGNGITEEYLYGGTRIGSNSSWGKTLTFREHSTNLGQAFNTSRFNIPFDKCKTMSYKYYMDNDDGWQVTFRLYATLSNGSRRMVAEEYRNIGNGAPRNGTLNFTCNF